MVSRLTRVTVNPDNTLQNPASPETVILGSDVDGPCPNAGNTDDCIPSDDKYHSIGTVRSDPVDGTLWIGSGDAHANGEIDDLAYRPLENDNFAGKIIHVDRAGNGLPGHPFCPADANLSHTCTKIHAKGFRNPFRFTLRPSEAPFLGARSPFDTSKAPVVGDVGKFYAEEVSVVGAGENHGWPCYEGDRRHPLLASEPRCQQEYAKEGTVEEATDPSWFYLQNGTGAAVITGPAYLGGAYPATYDDKVFVADYVKGWIKLLTVDANDHVTQIQDFATAIPAAVDLELGPSGDLNLVDIGFGAGGSVQRVTFGDGNLPPDPVANATPNSGEAPLTVQFTGSGSSDPEGDALTYAWDFGDGTPPSSEADPTHVYSSPGTYRARLTVDDGTGRNPNREVTIEVGANAAPTASINAPADRSTFRAGETIELSGSGSDAEDGALDGDALDWTVLLRHGTHLHDVASLSGGETAFDTYDDHDSDASYEITLTVTDSRGRQATDSIRIDPETSRLTLASSPPGAPIDYSGMGSQAAPFQRDAAVGFKTTIEAAPSFVSGGKSYAFERWSDGGAAKHAITVPAADTTLQATYAAVEEETADTTFKPVADAYVRADRPSTNFGASNPLRISGSASAVTHGYLRFNVQGLDQPVVQATLRVFARTTSSNSKVDLHDVASDVWQESAINWGNAPPRGPALARVGAMTTGQWVSVDATRLVDGNGLVSMALTHPTSTRQISSREIAAEAPQLIVKTSPHPLVGAAGAIACDPASSAYAGGNGTASACRQKHTAALLGQPGLNRLLTLGDHQYEQATSAQFAASYGPTWGAFKSITRPVPGDKDYVTSGASGYFDYFNGTGVFNGPAGDRNKGYYSFDIGSWHLVALNSNCARVGGCQAGSPQESWLRANLAASSSECVLAYMHHPRFSSGASGGTPAVAPLWQALYDNGADVVLGANDLIYERFAPQGPSGAADPASGIRQFTVGTGGKTHGGIPAVQPNSQVRDRTSFGVLKLLLEPDGYQWWFQPEATGSFSDAGTDGCG